MITESLVEEIEEAQASSMSVRRNNKLEKCKTCIYCPKQKKLNQLQIYSVWEDNMPWIFQQDLQWMCKRVRGAKDILPIKYFLNLCFWIFLFFGGIYFEVISFTYLVKLYSYFFILKWYNTYLMATNSTYMTFWIALYNIFSMTTHLPFVIWYWILFTSLDFV